MAIFRSGVRQGALGAMRQGQLGQFLGAHPRAGAMYNRAIQQNGGRAQQVAQMNAAPYMNRQQARMTLGQASGGRPMPMAGPGAGAGGGGGAGAPAPPTAQPPPPGAQSYPQQTSTLGGMPPFQAGGASQMPNFSMAGGNPMWNPYGGMGGMSGGNMYGQMNPGMYPGMYGNQALQGLMGSVNPGMQSVIGSRLGQMQQPQYRAPLPQNGQLGFGRAGYGTPPGLGGYQMGLGAAGQMGMGGMSGGNMGGQFPMRAMTAGGNYAGQYGRAGNSGVGY